jgi:membrane fusion protein (multidrug efflux system)
VLRVPRTAVREVDGRSSVFVVQADRVEGRAIKVEDTGGSDLTVVAGLRAGERIVTDGPASLRDGDRVRETRD